MSANGTDTGASAARAKVLDSIRTGLGVSGKESDRRAAVTARLLGHKANLVPARASESRPELMKRFRTMLEGQSVTVVEAASVEELPQAIAAYLRGRNLPLRVRLGQDPLWALLPWDREPALERLPGRAEATDTAGLSHAAGGAAETGTLIFTSGPDNPTTLNFLPETHIVVVKEADIVGSYEQIWSRVRDQYGEGTMPRTVNFISGPSRTGDIEQVIVMGAHGPRNMMVVVVKEG